MSSVVLDEHASRFLGFPYPPRELNGKSSGAYYAHRVERLANLILDEFTTRLILVPHTLAILMVHLEHMVEEMLPLSIVYGFAGRPDALLFNQLIEGFTRKIINQYTKLQIVTKYMGIAFVKPFDKLIADLHDSFPHQPLWNDNFIQERKSFYKDDAIQFVAKEYITLKKHDIGVLRDVTFEGGYRASLHYQIRKSCEASIMHYCSGTEKVRDELLKQGLLNPGTSVLEHPERKINFDGYRLLLRICHEVGVSLRPEQIDLLDK